MKVIIAGSRTINKPSVIREAMEKSQFNITEVVCGGARGVDFVGKILALSHGIPVKKFPADWEGYGKRAGHIRNAQMADYADALILVWDGKSRGSANMLKTAKERGLKIFEKIVEA